MSNNVTPSRRQCGTMSAHFRLLETDPGFRRRQVDLEHMTARSMMPGVLFKKVITDIPVVVHVFYNTQEENISDAQINSQISVLNRDFSARNKDKSKVPAIWKGLVADSLIKFTLAKKDPSGEPTKSNNRR